jgi:hypothetical protein
MRQLVKFLNLRNEDKILAISCALCVAQYAIALSVIPYSRVDRLWPARVRNTARGGDVRRIARFVVTASKIIPRATCLPQALAGRAMLARHGHASTIRIGVAPSEENGRFVAHAWLLSEGVTVLGGAPDEISRYTPLTDLGARET